MAIQTVFERHELKFVITEEQQKKLLSLFGDKLKADKYGKSLIRNIYFDTPSYLLIRNSLDKPTYKEKIRLRGYGEMTESSNAFLEVKKKFKGVVYKRRIKITEKAAMNYMLNGENLPDSQISKEIDYFISYYENLAPRVALFYEREAYYYKEDDTLRITFDKNIQYRFHDLTLLSDANGTRILDDGLVLMEVKTSYALPLWLTSFLSENKIYKRSFSKYGYAYMKEILNVKEIQYV